MILNSVSLFRFLVLFSLCAPLDCTANVHQLVSAIAYAHLAFEKETLVERGCSTGLYDLFLGVRRGKAPDVSAQPKTWQLSSYGCTACLALTLTSVPAKHRALSSVERMLVAS